MELSQIGFTCDFEMNIFINIFFKKTENGKITTSFKHENDTAYSFCEIDLDNKRYFSEFSLPFSNSVTDKKKIKKMYGICIVRSFIKAAKQIRDIDIPWGVLSGIRPAKYVRGLKEEGKTDKEVEKILTEIFDVSEKKCHLAQTVAKNEEKVLKRIKNNSVSLYIGIPFCPSRCLYCSFVSTDIKLSGKYMDEFVDLLIKEIEKTAEILKKLNFSVQNIYIGGGTPTTLSEAQLKRVLTALRKNFDIENLDEFTLEAGRPDTITKEKLIIAKENKVSRISINPQTLNQETLDLIGRKHTVEQFFNAYKIAKEVGFESINTDLIAGLPGETVDMFQKSIDGIIELKPENITVHSMCVKRSAELNFSEIKLTRGEQMNKMLCYAEEKICLAGKEPYYMYRQKNISGNLENVGYSDSKHFSFYNINIMEEAQTIIALGGGGVSKIVKNGEITRIPNFKEPYEYIRRFDEILAKKDEAMNLLK